jgi:hypothetical protein
LQPRKLLCLQAITTTPNLEAREYEAKYMLLVTPYLLVTD